MSNEFQRKRDLVCEFLSYLRVERGLAKNSIESYERDLAKLKSWADGENLELVELIRSDLREFVADLSREGLSPMKKCIASLSAVFVLLLASKPIKIPLDQVTKLSRKIEIPSPYSYP